LPNICFLPSICFFDNREVFLNPSTSVGILHFPITSFPGQLHPALWSLDATIFFFFLNLLVDAPSSIATATVFFYYLFYFKIYIYIYIFFNYFLFSSLSSLSSLVSLRKAKTHRHLMPRVSNSITTNLYLVNWNELTRPKQPPGLPRVVTRRKNEWYFVAERTRIVCWDELFFFFG
jgi:hypothetical protein